MLAPGIRVARGPDWIWHEQGKVIVFRGRFLLAFHHIGQIITLEEVG